MDDGVAVATERRGVAGFDSAQRERLRRGMVALGLAAEDDVVERLLRFAALLLRWNRGSNLTRITAPADVVDLHLLDSLSVARYTSGQTVLDVGTGGGLPGIPLAILQPWRQFVLLDSVRKKTVFLRQVVTELALGNVEVCNGRVESYTPTTGPDCILARAFAPPERMLAQTGHLLAPGARLLAMRAAEPLADWPAAMTAGATGAGAEFGITAVFRLSIPGRDVERHLVEVRRNPPHPGPSSP